MLVSWPCKHLLVLVATLHRAATMSEPRTCKLHAVSRRLLIFPIVSQDERAAFSAEIDSILAVSDLKIVSAKRIRQSLQEGRDQQDILSKKVSQLV